MTAATTETTAEVVATVESDTAHYTATVTIGESEYEVRFESDGTLSQSLTEGAEVTDGNLVVNGTSYALTLNEDKTSATVQVAGGSTVGGTAETVYSMTLGDLTLNFDSTGEIMTDTSFSNVVTGTDSDTFTVGSYNYTYYKSSKQRTIAQSTTEDGAAIGQSGAANELLTRSITFSLNGTSVTMVVEIPEGEEATITEVTGGTWNSETSTITVGDKEYELAYDGNWNSAQYVETAASAGYTGEIVNTQASGTVTIGGEEYTLASSEGTLVLTDSEGNVLTDSTVATTVTKIYNVNLDSASNITVVNSTDTTDTVSTTNASTTTVYSVTIGSQTFTVSNGQLLDEDGEPVDSELTIDGSTVTISSVTNTAVTYGSATESQTFTVSAEDGAITVNGQTVENGGTVELEGNTYTISSANGVITVLDSTGTNINSDGDDTFTVPGSYSESTVTVSVSDGGQVITWEANGKSNQRDVDSTTGAVTLAGGVAYTLSGSAGAYTLSDGTNTYTQSGESIDITSAGSTIATLTSTGEWDVTASDVTLINSTGEIATLTGAVSGALGANDTYVDGAIESNGVLDSYAMQSSKAMQRSMAVQTQSSQAKTVNSPLKTCQPQLHSTMEHSA